MSSVLSHSVKHVCALNCFFSFFTHVYIHHREGAAADFCQRDVFRPSFRCFRTANMISALFRWNKLPFPCCALSVSCFIFDRAGENSLCVPKWNLGLPHGLPPCFQCVAIKRTQYVLLLCCPYKVFAQLRRRQKA